MIAIVVAVIIVVGGAYVFMIRPALTPITKPTLTPTHTPSPVPTPHPAPPSMKVVSFEEAEALQEFRVPVPAYLSGKQTLRRVEVDVRPITPSPVLDSYVPVGLVAGAALFVALAFIFLSILLLRGMNVMSRRTGGAVTLTLASIILISGLWCYALSPPATRYEHESIVRGGNPTIGPRETQRYFADLAEGERLTGDVGYEKAFNVRIYDPDHNLIRSEYNVTHTALTVKALRSGSYEVEIENPNPESIRPFIAIMKQVEVPYRPLEPAGQWLSLVSIPIFVLGLWAFLSKQGRDSP